MEAMRAACFVVTLIACAPHHDLPKAGAVDAEPIVDGAPNAAYPAGPYGFERDSVMTDAEFEGYFDGKAPWGKVAIHDYYDPDGAKGIRALLFVGAGRWCPICENVAKSLLPEMQTKYAARGLRIVHVLREWANPTDIATRERADEWRELFKITYDNVIDPKRASLTWGSDVPMYLLVDPRTMKVVRRGESMWSTGDYPGVQTLIVANGG
jgi:hypothetical protein